MNYLDPRVRGIKWKEFIFSFMKTGMTGNLDEIYPKIVGKRNEWFDGNGDGWKRGPYWIDGLLPLAYTLDDAVLKKKAQPLTKWTTHYLFDNLSFTTTYQ